ncbi:MAG: hypothetical protein H6557_21155 [Lewinellaceae bacterium]|nr:hypothetical protein [Phaeodactylibacter sp.]MCB9039127.1 hypothetical protein [Lewinellaceae bacterium]
MFRFSLLFLFIQTAGLFAQTTIFLDNPSFEDVPSIAHPPQRWYFCGQPGESPPDIHPGGFFGVERLARDGATFVGMVVRDNGTHEGIGQRLASPLQAGHCYSFSLYAARSETYQSVSRATGAPANFSQPAALYLWGGFKNCDQRELLAKSPAILYEGWKKYSFSLQPQDDYTHLSIEAYFAIPGAPYNGNVLIDYASPLVVAACEEGREPLPEVEVVEAPDIRNAEELRALLREQGRLVRFSEDGILLEQHLFADEAGRQYQANLHLWKIAQALSRFPGYRLLISVGGTSDYLRQSHLRQFEQALRAIGLEEKQYRLRARRRSDRKREWLWGLGEREFAMRLEEG